MNLVCIPYHDWRKIEKEGTRTRDAHLIKHFTANKDVDKVVIINRPTTYLEMSLLKKNFKIDGEVLIKDKGLSLVKVNEKLFVIDYIANDVLSQVVKRKLWFFDLFGCRKFVDFSTKCFKYLEIDTLNIITHNIFSINFAKRINPSNLIFDAYDNQVFFPQNKKIKKYIVNAYKEFALISDLWITNSQENINYYKENYKVLNCYLVKNGVDTEMFSGEKSLPEDLKKIPSPIIGFGGKISHIVDSALINYITEKHSNKSFVFVGQILDKDVFNAIKKRNNVYYLGDKHYSVYPEYVANFDIGIVPYVSKKMQHGGDSMKVYEYLAAGLKVVGVPAGGMQDLSSYIYIANNYDEFSSCIDQALGNNGVNAFDRSFSWSYKAEYIIRMLKEI